MSDFVLFHVDFLIYGLMGGIVRVFFEKKATPREILGYIIVGGFASNFFVPLLLIMLLKGATLLTQIPSLIVQITGPLAFVVGMGGLRICRMADKILAGTLKRLERTRE